jgi:glycosyltransferase involved in cell wall biosynthesis
VRITLVITNLESGGAERVISIMANHWAKKDWLVRLLTFDDGSTPPFYDLDSRIRLIPLGIYKASSNPAAAIVNNLKRISVLRRAIRDSKPDVVISFLSFVNTLALLATRGLGVPVVVSERNNPLMDPIGPVWKLLRRWTYMFEAQIVVQTKRAQASFPPAIQARTTVIPNPVPPLPQAEHTPTDVMLAKPALVAMGNFYPQKGFDLLLKALARLKDRHPAWTLTILGEGPLRTQIESLRDALGLNGRVHLPGRVKNPHHVLKQADLFVLSSRWEGWPMALAEAMSCGLPVIAADCRMGPREIVRDGVDGVLVPPEDVEALAAAMDKLMSDESTRKRLASRAREVTERFPLEKVMSMWEELLRTVVLK